MVMVLLLLGSMEQGVPEQRILVVEDDANLRQSIVELLGSWGYQAEGASDGIEALEKVRAAEPLLILSDLKMPRMGGLELIKRLQHELRPVRCIVITGERNLMDEFQAITLGAFSFLEKPIYPEQLRAEIRSCLAATGAALPPPGDSRHHSIQA